MPCAVRLAALAREGDHFYPRLMACARAWSVVGSEGTAVVFVGGWNDARVVPVRATCGCAHRCVATAAHRMSRLGRCMKS